MLQESNRTHLEQLQPAWRQRDLNVCLPFFEGSGCSVSLARASGGGRPPKGNYEREVVSVYRVSQKKKNWNKKRGRKGGIRIKRKEGVRFRDGKKEGKMVAA